jgi:tol-pal system protein YbgF
VLKERDRTPELRVDVVGPKPAPPAAPEPVPAPAVASSEADEQLAYADDDVEIVYVGEAAKDESVRPSIELYETRARAPYRPRPSLSSRPGTRAPIARARVGDRIAVTRGKVPALPRESRRPDPRAEYKRHYQALRDGKHAAAIEGFRAFVADYPSHDYADNAQYWLGEAYYDQRKYDSALEEFGKVSDLYPKGNKVSDAMLKRAFCHEHLGRVAKARALLGQVIERYPKSNAAALAADRLVKLQADN